ncbi:MAG: hypothetical protein C5B49_03100 [Bdellovibrio sp.]|nr:MAG: hypothetical protein C5B49_03100 [Bdellovibrio sp.]
MTLKQSERSSYLLREAKKIAREVRENFQRAEYERVIRKTHEALELWLKGRILESGVEPAKIHDLMQLDQRLPKPSGLSNEDLLFLTTERIPAFYGAEDIIPDKAYAVEDGERCLRCLDKVGL